MAICAEAILAPIGERITNCAMDTVFRQLGYLVHFRSNVNDLKDQGKKLVETRDFVQHSVDSAKSNGDEIEGIVTEWLSFAHQCSEHVDTFLSEANGRSLRWWNMPSRHRFSRRATKLAVDVAKAIEAGSFERVWYRKPPQEIVTLRNSKKFEPFESRVLILKEIMEALADATASVVVVHGMAGVGKTTLVEEIRRLAKEGKLFDATAMVCVKRIPNIKKIQREIADQLGLKFEEEKERVRADRLRRRLEMEKKVLVILDDVWTKLDLEAVGISSHHKGCKILVTSRRDDLFFNDFGTQKNIEINILSKKEARDFFNKMASDSVESSDDTDPEMEAVATELADECGGLPLSLVTVGQALKGKGLPSWNDALQGMKFPSEGTYGVNKAAYLSVKLSYKSLDRDEARSLFLLCSLFPEDYQINIKYLLMYAIGLGLLNDISSLTVARWRVLSLVDKLKTFNMLLDGADSDFVKMHDTFRDAAILLASKIKSKYLVRHGATTGESLWPPMDEFKDYTAISLGCSDHTELPKFICPQLRFLLLVGKRTSLRLPDNFFAGMQELRVLDLTGLCIQQFPSSIDQLVNLQTLCLDDCVLPDMSTVGELKKLEILSLRASDIIALPGVIGELTNLKMLNLSDCSKLKEIPAKLLSRLTGLSELYLDNSFKNWNVGQMGENINARISELDNLQRLTTLHVHIPDPTILPSASLFRKLSGYRILIGDGWDWSGKYGTSKTLKLKLDRSIQREDAIQALLENTEDLYIDELEGAKNILFSLDHKGFPKLKCLCVNNNIEIVSVINSDKMLHPNSAFPLLESLFLKNLAELGSICRGRLPQMSFRNLKSVEVESCNRLKFVFPPFMVRGLIHLQKLEISECGVMETIVSKSKETEMQINGYKLDENMIEFPELRSLILQHLPALMGFYYHDYITMPSTRMDSHQTILTIVPSYHPLLNQQVTFPKLETLKLHALNSGKIWQDQLPSSFYGVKNLTSLSVEGCASLKYLMTSTVAKSLAKLERLEIINCKLMKAIIISKDQDLDNDYPSKSILSKEDVFPSLESLVVSRMDVLETLWDNEASSGSFTKLKKVDIRHCKKLETIFPNYMLNKLTNLERLNVTDCSSLVEIFQVKVPVINGNQEAPFVAYHLKEMKLLRLPKLKHIWSSDPRRFLSYPSLQLVHTIQCQSLLNLFPLSIAKDLIQLEELKIQFCGVEVIVANQGDDNGDGDENASFVLRELTSLSLWNLFEFKRFYPGRYTLDFPSLRLLDVRNCKSFKLMEGTSENSSLSLAVEEAEDDQTSLRGKLEKVESDVLKETSTRKEEITTTVKDIVQAELIELRAQLQALVVSQRQMMESLDVLKRPS